MEVANRMVMKRQAAWLWKHLRIIVVSTLIVAFIAVAIVVIAMSFPQKQAAPRLSGLCFSPFLGENPRNASSVKVLLDKVAPYTGGIRTFGSTDEWAKIPAITRRMDLYLAAGAGIYGDRNYDTKQVAGLVKLVKTGKVDLAVVGDETLMWNSLTEDELISYIKQVKATGVTTTTSEHWENLLSHPTVMQEVDVIVVNIYPFWEGVSVNDAIGYIDSIYRKVKARVGDKEVIVETGWPSAGKAEGKAATGPENAARYLSDFTSWADSKGVRYFYFEAFDEPWKIKSEGSVGAHWGLWDKDGNMKQYARTILNNKP